ncbi:uncharacterized protein LOC134695050 [Mytilus trossulus]|uniref:uncharacterized protein LOC134695050 n=1 Tax=Mytilus trossulus TaxID=6551 RepID=UPI003007A7F6
MDNQNDLQFLSVKLYHHLSDVVVGSEKAVKYRRYFYKCFDETSLFGQCKVISSGSKAEGLDLPGSDMDYMFLAQGYMVEEKLGNTKEKHLVLDTDNALPGFALIKISDNSDFIGNINVIQTVDGQLLKNDILKQSRFQVMNEAPSMFDMAKVLKLDVQTLCKVQGPAITTAIEGAADVDFVYCLPCREWPSIAKRWLHRSRCFKWPSSDLITEAIHGGVLLVPVGSKSPSTEENNTEWRFSFSLTEKLLVHSFNHTQLLCYALLKIVLKEIFNKVNIFNKLLCSYYLKTVLFWVLEEVDHQYWVPENLLRCFSLCLQRLHYFISCNYIPNYFIPEHNKIEGRFSKITGKELGMFAEKLLIKNIWKVLLSIDLLSDLRRDTCYVSKPLKVISEFDKTIIAMKIPDCTQWIEDISCRSLSFFVHRIRNENCETFFKNIYATALLDLCKRKAISIKMRSINSQNISNKFYYSKYKQCLFHLLLNLSGDAVSGWLLLATFFYSCQEYRKMNVLLQLSEEIISRDIYTVSILGDLSAVKQTTFEKKLVPSKQFLKRLRHSVIRYFNVQKNEQNADSFIFHQDLSIDGEDFFMGTPLVFIRYLTFLYFYRQNNTEGMNSAIMMLREAVEKSPQLDASSITRNYWFLGHALSFINDNIIERIETIRSMISAVKPFDVTGLIQYWTADFENIISPLLKVYRKDS